MRPDLVDDGPLVEFVGVFWEVLQQREASPAVRAGKQLDEMGEDDGGVVLGQYVLAHLQHKGKDGGCRRTAKLQRGDEGREDLVRRKLGRERRGRFVECPADTKVSPSCENVSRGTLGTRPFPIRCPD